MGQDVRSPRGPRCIALVGPFQSGKTTLLEAILARTGAIRSAGSVDAGTSVGDASPEARHHKMGVGAHAPPPPISWATATPSSIVPARSNSRTTCAPRFLRSMPRWWSARPTRRSCRNCRSSCANWKIWAFRAFCSSTRSTAPTSASARRSRPCSRPRACRWCCGRSRSGTASLIEGFVDLALERAFVYREHKASEVVGLEGGNLDREKEARFSMLEKLADHDDALMEQLLEDIQPPRDAVFDDLARELREGTDLSGTARLGGARERRAAADEGAAP